LVQRLAAAPELASHGYRIFVPAEAEDDVIAYLTTGISIGTHKDSFLFAAPGERALMIAYGGSPAAQPDQARQMLGEGATLLGTGPTSPTGRPEFVVYGRDAEAAQVVGRMLARYP
jgi:hypothetical protein